MCIILPKRLPEDHHLQNTATAHLFFAIISQGIATKSQVDGDALQQYFHNG
jgi:hypothetical protein